MIRSQSRHDKLMISQKQSEQGIVLGCSITFLIFGIAALVVTVLGMNQDSYNLGLILPLTAGIIFSSIGILGIILPYAIRLIRYSYKKIKANRNTPAH